jgi:hypothetical protein
MLSFFYLILECDMAINPDEFLKNPDSYLTNTLIESHFEKKLNILNSFLLNKYNYVYNMSKIMDCMIFIEAPQNEKVLLSIFWHNLKFRFIIFKIKIKFSLF